MIGIKEEQLFKEISLKPRTLEEISKLMSLSERSIRYKIKDLNEFFKDEKLEIEVVLKKNIVEIIGDITLLEKKINFSKFNSYIFSQSERMEILKNILLFNEKKFQAEEYQEIVDISESTFKKDWKLLRENFENLGIKIINRKYYTYLEGDEEKIRNNILKNIVKYKINNSNVILLNKKIKSFIDKYFGEIDFIKIEKILSEISESLNITMSDDAYNIIKFNLAVTLKRMKQSPLKLENIKNSEFLRNTEEYNIIKKILEKYNKDFKSKEYMSEVINLTEYVHGSHSYNFKYSFYKNWIHIESIVDKLIKSIEYDLNLSFQNDLELFEGILNHIKPMIYRIRKGIKLENIITKEIMEESPEIFLSLKKNISLLENFIKCKVDDDELSYLCVFFKLALKRLKSDKIPRVVIVCSFGYGVSKVLEARLRNRFNITILKTLPQNKLSEKQIIENKVDFIITTTTLKNINWSIPVIRVSPLLTDEDIKVLKSYGFKDLKISDYYNSIINIISENCDEENAKKLKEEISNLFGIKLKEKKYENSYFLDFITKKEIKVIDKIKNFEEGIIEAGKKLENSGTIKKEYIENCIKAFLDQGAYMVIGENTILPHSDDFKSVNKTSYSFLKLKVPFVMKYDETFLNIENIILLASKDGKEHRSSLLDLKNMIDKYQFEKNMHNCFTEQEILKMLKKINSNKNGGNL